MHANPAFRSVPPEALRAFARARGFGVLAVDGDEGPVLSHVPFLLSGDGGHADLHLTRANPIAQGGGGAAVIAVSGPDGYVSPDWYWMPDQVPTRNHVAVHLRGRLEPLPDAALRPNLDALSAAFEGRLCPKAPWTADTMAPGTMERMMRMILPFRLTVTTVAGTWNKPEAARLGAADGVAGEPPGADTVALAALMRAPPGG